MRKTALLFLCGTGLFTLLGCASSPIEYTQQTKLPTGEGLVCGRVVALRNGEPIIWQEGPWASTGMSVYVMPETSKAGIPYRLRGDGLFCWHLRPGRYFISGFQRGNGAYSESGRLWAGFTVPADGSQTCLGTLVVRFTTYRYSYDVFDGCDAIIADLKTNSLATTDDWHEQLLVLDPPK